MERQEIRKGMMMNNPIIAIVKSSAAASASLFNLPLSTSSRSNRYHLLIHYTLSPSRPSLPVAMERRGDKNNLKFPVVRLF
jgi:hypothetical protein